MGEWGAKNFQNDDALDALGYICLQIIDSIRENLSDIKSDNPYKDLSDTLVAQVDVLSTLINHYEFQPILELDEVETWKKDYLVIFDRVAKNRMSRVKAEREEEFRTYFEQRRQITHETFDLLYKNLFEVINK